MDNQQNQPQQPNPGSVITPNNEQGNISSPPAQQPSVVAPSSLSVTQNGLAENSVMPAQDMPQPSSPSIQNTQPQPAPTQNPQLAQQSITGQNPQPSPTGPAFMNPAPSSSSTPPVLPASPKKSNKKIVLAVVIFAIVLLLGGGVFAFTSMNKDKNPKTETNGQSADASSKEETKVEPSEIAITKSYELNVVCEGTAWPSNATQSTDGTKKTMVFAESSSSPGEYKQATVTLNEANRTDYDNQTNVDYVACLKRTDVASESVTCDFTDRDNKPIKATMVRKDFELTVYNLKTKEKVAEGTKVAASKKCKTITLVNANNEFDADPDESVVKVEIAKL